MSKNNLKNSLYGVAVLAVIGGLFAWPILTDPTRPLVKAWNGANIECLSGHQNAKQHIHQNLHIYVDGKPETLSGDIGIVRNCMAEIHVHADKADYLHLESILAGKTFKLSDWFIVYGKPLEREGYTLKMKLGGVDYVGNPADLVLEDKQDIELNYTSISPADTEPENTTE